MDDWLYRIATSFILVIALAGPTMLAAQSAEDIWGIRVDLLPGQSFKQFGEAQSALKSPTTDQDAPWLVAEETEQSAGSPSTGDAVTKFSIPPTAALENLPGTYQDGYGGGPMFGSEAELVAYLYSQRSPCSQNIVFTSAYYVVEDFTTYTVRNRTYSHTIVPWEWDHTTETYVCGTPSTHDGFVKWQVNWVCPDDPPYRGAMSPSFKIVDGQYGRWCSHPLKASITVPMQNPIVASPPGDDFADCVGNPCSPGTGNKSEREVDYDGGALRFERAYNSLRPVRMRAGLGPRWTHNFGQRLFFGTYAHSPVFWQRADGQLEVLQYRGVGIFSSADASGVELRDESGTWVLYENSGARSAFSGTGQLEWTENAAGQRTILTYDGDDRLTMVTGPFGHTLQLTYSGDELVTMTDSSGENYDYSYSSGRLTQVTYPDGSTRSYHYEDLNLPEYLTGITDENADRYATFAYDDWGRATLTEHAGGYERFTLTYNADATTTVTDALGNLSTYSYDYYYRHPLQVTKAGGYLYRWYNSYGRPKTSRNANGKLHRYYYNQHHMTSMLDPGGRTTSFTYLDNETDKPTLVRSPSVYGSQYREVTTTYTPEGWPATISISGYTPSGTPVSRTVSFQYNSAGQVTQIDGPRTDVSDITTIEYYVCATGAECGQVETITNALGHIKTFDTYDPHGRLLQMTDPNGLVTTYTYDLRGRLLSMTEAPPAGAPRTTSYTYDAAGQLASVTTPAGSTLTYAYDAAHNLVSITDSLGNQIEYGYDLNGNRTDEDIRDPAGVLTAAIDLTYDARNRIDTINTGGSVTDLLFDALGNLTDETDPNLNDTDHTYDPLNRLTQTLDALSGTTSYAYDVNDELVLVTAPNNAQTTYSYDDLGNRLSLSSPDTGLTTYTYDAAGNRITQTDARGVTTTYTYDALNRLASVSYPDSSLNISYGYDGGTNQIGQLTSMTDGAGTSNYSYDAFGNRTGVSRAMDGVVHTTGFEYDADDRLSAVTYPSGRRVDYTRNAAGEVTSVTSTYGGVTEPVASSIVYAPFGPLVSLDFGNGLSLIRIYDLQYRLTDQVTSDGATPIEDLALLHDPGGNIDQIADASDPTRTRTFDYDALDRLISDTGDYGVLAMSYDPVGNRLSLVTDDGVSITTDTLTYSPASNRLSLFNALAVTIDAAGNTLDDARGKTYTYGDHGRLLSASVSGALQAAYAYDGHGQRVRKLEATGSGRRYHYHYGPAGELLAETLYDSAGTLIEHRDYLWLDGMPLAQATGSTIVFLHTDQLDTPRLATDAVGTVIWRWASDGFGVGAADEDPDGDGQATVVSLRFPGQYYDQETGLHYNYYRTYDPTTGRYLESDPIGLAGGWNTYGYALQNPLSYTDPTGESAVARVLTGLGADTAVPDPSDAAWPKWAFWGALLAGAYVYDVCTDSDDDNFCYSRWEAEDSRCWQWKNLGMRHVKACQDRAATRRNMCNQNGGKPNPLEPPEYSPFRDYPR